MVCVPKAALIPDGDLAWVGGLGLVRRPVQMCGRRRRWSTCVMGVPGATGNIGSILVWPLRRHARICAISCHEAWWRPRVSDVGCVTCSQGNV